MKVTEMISKWRLSLATKPDGTDGIKPGKKLTEKQIKAVVAKKDEVIAELKRIKAEEKAKWEKRQQEREEKRLEYIKTANLGKYLVKRQDEFFNVSWSIQTLVMVEDGRVFEPEYFVEPGEKLEHVTETIEEMRKKDFCEFGLAGVAWVITPKQEAQIVAEQVIKEKEEKKEAEIKEQEKAKAKEIKEAAEKAEVDAKFAEAKETGKPVVLERLTAECSDRNEECNTDIVTRWAMPDGSTKTERHHTW